MGFRFQRSLKLAPRLRINLSASGLGLSVGVPGARVSVGPRGLTQTTGIPGTGLSWRATSSHGSAAPTLTAPAMTPEAPIAVQDDGTVVVLDASGAPVPQQMLKRILDPDTIREWLEAQCERWNTGIDQLLTLHIQTPPPDPPQPYVPIPFSDPPPAPPAPRSSGFLGSLLPGRRERIKDETRAAQRTHDAAASIWSTRKNAHDAAEARRAQLVAQAHAGDGTAMHGVLAARFEEIAWPRETIIAFEVCADRRAVLLDVDLPEIEDMPTEQATPAARQTRILVKPRSPSQRQREYMTHVHAIAFRVTGEVFAALPTAETVVVSAFSQRPSKATGQVSDEYLLSARVSRTAWERINFDALDAIDLPTCFEEFELRRKMTRAGVFTPIEPFANTRL